MNIAVRKPRMNVAEFRAMTEPFPEEERWELIDGEAVLKPPLTIRHQMVVMNLLRALDRLARPRGCWALPGIGLLNDDVDTYAPIPDVVVRCGPMLNGGYARDPVLLAEVLSPSSIKNDLGVKLEFNRTLATLRTSIVVYQDEVRVEAWQRQEGGEWRALVRQARSDVIAVPELGGELRLADIYENIPLPS